MIQESFIRSFERSFRENWERPALSDYFKEDRFSYGEMAAEIARLHIIFEAGKVKRGDKIALIGRNNTRWCITFMAAVSYGAVIVPILQDFNANDVHHIVNHSDAVLFFVGEQHWDLIEPKKIENVRAAFSLIDFRCLYERKGDHVTKVCHDVDRMFGEKFPGGFGPEQVVYPEIPNTEMAVLNYTSGTTGFSKGVMITGNNLAGNIRFAIAEQIYFPGSRGLSFLPLAHAYGCMFDFLYPLAVGVHITLLGKMPSPKVLVEALGRVKPYIVICVPLIVEKIYKKQILPMLDKGLVKFALKLPFVDEIVYGKIREKLDEAFGGEFDQVVIGGAPLNDEVEEFLKKIGFRFTVGYGMTECAPLISFRKWDTFVGTSCGRVLPGYMEARIDSPDPKSVPGEILVRGENVMAGYYKNEAATRDALVDGWLHTGDIGTLDEDNNLYIRGRSKSMILSSNGQNIYPEEIESKLNNMYCVMESLVVQRDNKLMALVYPDYDQMDAFGITQNQLKEVMEKNKEELNKTVGAYERIAEIILYPHEFEKTPKKSIRRYLYTV